MGAGDFLRQVGDAVRAALDPGVHVPTAVPHLPTHPAIDAVLSTAATLLGMEVIFLGGLTDQTFTFERVHANASWPGTEAGESIERSDSFCHRMLAGAPSTSADIPHDPAYADAAVGPALGARSYVGVPVRDEAGVVVATLCGIDRNSVEVAEETIGVLRQLAQVIAVHLGPLASQGIVIRRAPEGIGRLGAIQYTGRMTLVELNPDLAVNGTDLKSTRALRYVPLCGWRRIFRAASRPRASSLRTARRRHD